MSTLGLVGGLGLGAGIYYYQELAKTLDARGARLRLLLAHADLLKVLGHVRAAEIGELTQYLRGIIQSLSLGGADFAAISAVVPHACIAELTAASPIPILSILDVVGAELDRRGLRRVALFGTRLVIETDLYGCLSVFEVARPNAVEITMIDDTYRALAMRGHGTPQDREILTSIALGLCSRERLDAIVLAGTDLSTLFETEEPEFPSIDCSRLHIAAIAERLLRS